MTQTRDQFKHAGETAVEAELPFDGDGRTILVDALALNSVTDTLVTFLTMAEKQDYRVIIQSPTPREDIAGMLARKRAENAGFDAFMQKDGADRAVLLQGSPAILRGQSAPYLRITIEHNFIVSEWSPVDRRLALNTLFWGRGPQRSLAHIQQAAATARAGLSNVTQRLRHESMRSRTALLEALQENGIDPDAFFQRIQDDIDRKRGLGPVQKP